MGFLLAVASVRPARPGVTFFARAKKVTKESTPRVRARSSLHDERVPGRSDVLGVASTRHPVATKLSRTSCPADPLRAPLQPALPGVENLRLAARFASPPNNATRSQRCAVAVAFDVGPLVAHRAAQRAQGTADKDVRRASSRQDVASKLCPEHVSSAGDFRAAKVRHQGVLSLGYFSLHKQREVTRPTGRNNTRRDEPQFVSKPAVTPPRHAK
jgi:hypothetical protein